jgi:hypothetical protein
VQGAQDKKVAATPTAIIAERFLVTAAMLPAPNSAIVAYVRVVLDIVAPRSPVLHHIPMRVERERAPRSFAIRCRYRRRRTSCRRRRSAAVNVI